MFEKLTEVRLHFPKPIHIIKKPNKMRLLDKEDSILLFYLFYFILMHLWPERMNPDSPQSFHETLSKR